MAHIKVRREALEYGSVPLSLLLPDIDAQFSLQELHSRFHSVSTVNSNGVRVISAQEVASCLSYPEQNLRVLASCIEAASPHQSCYYDDKVQLTHIALYDLSLFLFAELYGREVSRPEATDHWPEPSSSSADAARSTSPNPKASSSGQSSKTLLRQQLQQHVKFHEQQVRGFAEYIKRNLKAMLQLVLDSPEEPHTTSNEVNRLAFLLLAHRDPPPTPSEGPPPPRSHQAILLSSVLPCFDSTDTALRTVVLQLLAACLSADVDGPLRFSAATNGMSSIKIQRDLGLVGSAGHVDAATIQGLYRGTVVRGELDFPSGELHVVDCHDAVVYALAPLQRVMVSGCSDCTVILGAIGVAVRVEKCDKVLLVAACSRIIINTCHDCTFHLGVTTPPVLIGDNRFITLAPHNVRYERLNSHIRNSRIRTASPNLWNTPIILTSRERRSSHRPESPRWFSAPDSPLATSSPTPKPPVTLLPPEDFLPYTVPFKGSSGFLAGGPSTYSAVKWSSVGSKHPQAASSFPYPLPPEYEAALAAKHAYVSELRGKIKSAVLEEGKRRELQGGIQAFFREWLGSSNNIRQVYDLSKLEGEDAPAASAATSNPASNATANPTPTPTANPASNPTPTPASNHNPTPNPTNLTSNTTSSSN